MLLDCPPRTGLAHEISERKEDAFVDFEFLEAMPSQAPSRDVSLAERAHILLGRLGNAPLDDRNDALPERASPCLCSKSIFFSLACPI